MLRSLPFILSAFAVLLALYAALRGPPGRSGACACAGEVTRAEHDHLRSQMRFLASAFAQRAVPAVAPNATVVEEPSAGSADDALADRRATEITRVDAPSGLSVNVAADGAVSVQNRDPALSGQTMVVHGHRADGTLQPITIIVPPVAP
jgi:hypothetical protein